MRKLTVLGALIGLVIGVLLPANASAAPATGATARCAASLDGGGSVLYYLCGTHVERKVFSNGAKRAFAIDEYNAVRHIVRYPSGTYSQWNSLGGELYEGVWMGGYNSNDANNFWIESVGKDGRSWCRELQGGSFWTPWSPCA